MLAMMKRRLLCWSLFVLLAVLVRGQDDIPLIDNLVDVGGFVDTTQCYANLITADANFDRQIDRSEYVTFVVLTDTNDVLGDPQSFGELPLLIQLTFNALACLCREAPGATEDCCLGDNAHISNEGAAPGETPTPEQEAYLYTVCFATEAAIDRVAQSIAPSLEPSSSPTVTPGTPTVSPTALPTVPPGSPTASPTTGPTSQPEDFVIAQPYEILVDGGINPGVPPEDYEEDLVVAMDLLASELAVEGSPGKLRRRLVVRVNLPTIVVGTFPTPCASGVSADDQCRDVQHSIVLTVQDEVNNTATAEAYQTALNQSVYDGALERALRETSPESPVTVTTGLPVPVPTPAPSSDGLSGGAIAGIAIAAAAVCAGAAGYLVYRRSQREKDDHPYFPSPEEEAKGSTLGAKSPDYGKKQPRDFSSLDTGGAVATASSKKAPGDDSSSNAGSSGWSSSAGVSSLNTADSDYYDKPGGRSLAAMGGDSGIAAKNISSGDVPDLPAVTREDLDTAIEAGDWAAVGATAALLAAASDSQSYSSKSKRSVTSSKESTISSIDAARAAELDHLVDAGDWEGVVLAAARFEKSEGDSTTSRSGSASKSRTTQGSGSRTGSVGTSSAYSQGESTSVSETPSKAAKRAEIRQEVEALVRRVVPDEIDNVDEMMLQFRGREEELVETLRTMQERSIAQRARAAERKSAKIQARDEVRRSREEEAAAAAAAAAEGGGGLSGGAIAGIAAGGAVAAAGVAAAVGAASKDDKEDKRESEDVAKASSEEPSSKDITYSSTEAENDSKKRRTALEMAIEAGDWEAVGEAAAMMSDASVTTDADTAGEESSTESRRKRTGVNAERAEELDKMIDKGDWTGVVAAAAEFSKTDKEGKSAESSPTSSAEGEKPSWHDKKSDASTEDSSKARAIKEEQDALAQAEVWMAIAEQSKTEGSTEAAGASDAADWAIARSLSALRHAEAGGELKGDAGQGSGASPDGDGSTGDKSV